MSKNKKPLGSIRLFGRTINYEVNRGTLTSIGDTVSLEVKGAKNKYHLLPQGKIFICFSGNTSEYVRRVQNELLIENLDPSQAIEWVPMAWNVLTPINTIGTAYNAQDVINTYIEKADHIVFIVKDDVADGLRTEWEKFSKLSSNKTIHLFIYDNENRFKIHNVLDPLKQFVHSPYMDYKDILLYLKAKVHPQAILTGNERKLHFVQTQEQLTILQIGMKQQLEVLKREKINPKIILGIETLIHSIEENGPEILMKNNTNAIKQPALIKLVPTIPILPITVKAIQSVTGTGGKFKHYKIRRK